MITTELLSRIQFGTTIAFHILFSAFSMKVYGSKLKSRFISLRDSNHFYIFNMNLLALLASAGYNLAHLFKRVHKHARPNQRIIRTNSH